MNEYIRQGDHVVLRLPSDTLKVIQIQPNTTVSIGKFGTFQVNHIIGRPLHLTYEILDSSVGDESSNLRVVPTSELHELDLGEPEPAEDPSASSGDVYEIIGDDGKVLMRTNQHIKDDGVSQKLTTEEIEALKKTDSSGGKQIIAKLLDSHSALDKKTSFSLAKYTLRKTKKYMKRFTVLPLDIPSLIEYLLEGRDGARIMDIREETLGLMMSYANVHWADSSAEQPPSKHDDHDSNRWLVVDELSGLLVASLADHMGILHLDDPSVAATAKEDAEHKMENRPRSPRHHERVPVTKIEEIGDGEAESQQITNIANEVNDEAAKTAHRQAQKEEQQSRIQEKELAMSATSNSITIVHQNAQPNLSLLTYFGYDISNPNTKHPLYTNLKEISFLQLLQPEADYAYQEPTQVPEEELKVMKSRQKAAYYRKRRRWQRTKAIVKETQAGGFAGLVVASTMDAASILQKLVPLLRGGAQVVVFSPSVEPLTELTDMYSKGRRTAFTTAEDPVTPSEEFPVDPRLLISTALQSVRSRPWQVLPGRTHPKMSGRGGPEGYVFVGTRVYPLEGKIEGRGSNKRRKTEASANGSGTPRMNQNGASQTDDRSNVEPTVKLEDDHETIPVDANGNRKITHIEFEQ